ncbi:dynamin family protein [Sclerotinia borealis F-4128]|uniref:Dynamin family protein n=1 Tax=Sclerotinia borealis (strain F-4128) TaxID=1432307 RepID=W9C8Q6_SCLBF|nr:dynamin family protein [Sclerotinia borealis F-4128]
MVLKPYDTADSLQKLCSKEQLELLNSIDTLRSQGISHYVSLPQIIVCGDQSSGKSSVLEAISGVSFPIQSNLCTRFPTELILRKTPEVGATVSIVAHQSSSDVEKLRLGAFHETLDNFQELPTLIENAKAAMGITSSGKAFSNHLLKVEVSGPDHPHLTIVDLPGLIHSETKQQSAADVALVQEMVRTYMNQPRSIILAVVSAKNDYANQVVLNLSREADKKGTRTLGVITKPDTLRPDSDSEAMYVALAKNQNVEFRLGWHVLKNMDSETGSFSLTHRNLEEEQYFSRGAWRGLPHSILGIEELRLRLSQVLLDQIVSELPSLVEDIQIKSDACQRQLEKLGQPRATFEDQRMYLFDISQSFQVLVKAAIDGVYNDPFFGNASSRKRIRAVVQNSNIEFAERMTTCGHSYDIRDSQTPAKTSKALAPRHITKNKFIDLVEVLMKLTRGRELPGTFNPMIVVDLFRDQSTSWEEIARDHIAFVWKDTKTCMHLALEYVADPATSKALFQTIFEPALKKLLDGLHEKTADLLKSHQEGHPITYNHYFTDNLQKARNKRSRDACTKIIKSFFGVDKLGPSTFVNQSVNLDQLVTALVDRTEPDMNRFACSEAMDCMLAYYKVALKRFIDDIAIEVVEGKLIGPLADMFSPRSVAGMTPDLITRIAGECEASQIEREKLKVQLEILSKGLDTCKHFIGIGGLVPDTPSFQTTPRLDPADQEVEEPQFDTEDLKRFSESEVFENDPDAEPCPIPEECTIEEPCDELSPLEASMISWGMPISTTGPKRKGRKFQYPRVTQEPEVVEANGLQAFERDQY